MQRSANDKVIDIATAIAEMISVDKYGLSFYYAGKCLSLQTKLGDEQIGLDTQEE